jgi:hypothetical protein
MLGPFVCARYRFVLEATSTLRLSAFAGATLRGGFGHVFKKTVCLWPPADCPNCLLKNTCAYPYIFETAPPPGAAKLRNLDQIPRPFVLEPPEEDQRLFQPGERFAFCLVLVGRGIDYLPYFLFTFNELGRIGLGPGRGQFRLVEVHAEGLDGSQCVYTVADGKLRDDQCRITAADLEAAGPQGKRLAIHFLTPTRIRTEGKVQADIRFQDLVRALLRRLSSLCYFHCGGELAVDFPGLIEQAGRVRTVSSDLKWEGQERFSGRQHQWVDMSGLVGTIVFEAAEAEALGAFLPLLAAGEWVHMGKGVVMGLGKYRVEL